MITLRLTRGDSYETVSLQLPATPGEVGEAFAQLDEISRHAGETKIVEASSPVRNLGKYLRGMDLSGDGLDKLGRLAERIDNMSRREHQIFSGALDAESVNGLDDVLRIADSLADYEIIPEVSSDREVGNDVVDRGLIMDFPEAVRPYLDYVAIGAAYYADHGGAYTLDGYVKRREEGHDLAKRPVFSVHLLSHYGARRALLDLPASEEVVEATRRHLQVHDLSEADVMGLDCAIPSLAKLLPLDRASVEDAAALAGAVQMMRQSDGELRKYLAVLSVEGPEDFPAALELARDLDNYERITERPYEYGRTVPRRRGASEKLLKSMEGCTDFERLGEDAMAAEGVRQTEFGLLRRLNGPFSEQSQNQAMTQQLSLESMEGFSL